MNSPTPLPIPLPEISFNRQQMLTLIALRDLYQEQHGFFTQRELGRLRFLRWLVHSPRWNLAMDQPERAHERHSVAPERSIWTLGFTG